ncbi:hypothetical protein DFH08DRAFT_700878 [Mycena albidolilacea]|uniref:RING-type domain-containing protein n=1 Tax=Mycena albidolilacea TaxID=1033008 RepID=A0AAD6ZZR0_9AGAR|nr:hypothetical protein DFH08DRAFT_700878 [Mycena albidolilacea]
MTPVSISGTTPGVLDTTQPLRLLRRPSSTLSFASFDPRVASADHGWDLRSLSLNEELYRPKRVVIETTCSGESSWRFVPKARCEDGVLNEGSWPRVIDLCGQLVECDQDQWDIYKLDPAYDCLVRAPPEVSAITAAAPKPPAEGKQPLGKHRMSSAEPCPEMRPSKPFHLHSRKSEEDEVADMVVDDGAMPSMRHDPEYRSPEEEASRNTVNYLPTKTSKRTRTLSPGAVKRDLETRRLEREKKKREKREREFNHRKQQRFEHFLNGIYSEVSNNNHAGPNSGGEEDKPAEVDVEAEREAFIAEARRKLAELEADRPLWEEEAKKRAQREKEEQEARRTRMAEQRRAAEAPKAEEARRARQQQQARAREEARVRAGEERARRDRERRQRNERWGYGLWTTQRALERYKVLSDIFDSTKFSADDPITFDVVPWPMLAVKFSLEDIDWAAVEGFFNAVKPHMRSQDFASFVEKSHRRFHPDRWRSRGLLKSVADETERGCLEVGMIRSAGDRPASSLRSPEPVLFQPSRRSESGIHSLQVDPNLPIHDASGPAATVTVPPTMPRAPNSAGLVIERAILVPPDVPDVALPTPPPPPPPAPAPAAPLPTHNISSYNRIMTFFGYGRSSRERKLLVSLWYNLAWGLVQVALIITMLAIGAHTESKTMPGHNEWDACDRPLGAWACIYVFRVVFSSSLTYWGWLRDRKIHANAEDTENAPHGSTRPATTNAATPRRHPPPAISPASPSSTTGNPSEVPALPHSILYSRLSILSSLITLSWFLTAHILEYTSIHTCRFSSPHLWWLTFGILCIMYLVVLEVIILGFVVFVVAPIIFLFWNIFLMCLGRHPMQNPGMIRPDVGKLSPSIVDRIPLVMYIPPPPDALAGSIPIPQAVYSNNSYPPKAPAAAKPKRRFRFLHRRKGNKEASSAPAGDVPVRTPQQPGEPQTWQDHWEHTGYPFVILEGNRAACAVCLMDFEEPKRIAGLEPAAAPSAEESESVEESESAPSAIQEVPVESDSDAENQLKLEDAGEGAVPLRLLACGHVFHKTCLDPWLTDVSGRCPVCQKAVELPAKPGKKQRRG